MNTYTPVPPKDAPARFSKTHLGSNVRTIRFVNEVTQCLVEDVTLADTRDLSAVAFTPERLARMMERAR